ncbi:MAG: TonB-dependent receptor, partial [Bacteroidota bacterium]
AGGGTSLPTNDDFNRTSPLIPGQKIGHLKFILDNSFRLGKNRLALNVGWQSNSRKEFGDADAPQEEELYFQLRTINYNALYHFADKNGWTNSIGINGMQQQNKNKGTEVLIPEYRLFDIGAFIYLQKTKGAFTYSGGIRFDNRTLHSDKFVESNETKFQAFSKNFRNVSGSAGISYAASEKVLFKLNVAKGFRAPGIPELASNGTHEGTNRYEYGNRNLKSESSFQADAAVEVASDHVLFTAALFYNRINNFIYYSKLQSQSGTDSVVDVNGDLTPAFAFAQKNASLFGGEFSIDIHPHPLDWLHWENTFSYVRGRFATAVENTINLPLIPAARWISEVRGEFFAAGKSLRNLAVHMEVDRTFAQNKNF